MDQTDLFLFTKISKIEMTASVQGTKSKHTKGSNERYLIWTRQNNVHIFGNFCLRQRDERTNRYKSRNVVNTYLNVTFEDRFSKSVLIHRIGLLLPTKHMFFSTIQIYSYPPDT